MAPEQLATRILDIVGSAQEVYVHADDARALGLHALDRVRVLHAGHGREATALLHVATSLVPPGTAGLSFPLAQRLKVDADSLVRLRPAGRPESVEWIKRKLDGHPLTARQVAHVLHDVGAGKLTSIEITAWACAVQARGMDTAETVACVRAMVDSGERIEFRTRPILDVHSIGGVPGNKYAPIAVSIAAAHGLKVPKTSSRAISSACGTADFMEVVCPVALSAEQIRTITEKVGATLAWGGGVNLAPADDEIIRVEYPLSLDPPSQMIASVLAKKVAVGASHVLIDIPVGEGAKMQTPTAATELAQRFEEVGAQLGLKVECMLTQGDRPLGRAIGPLLEVREALSVLEGATEPASLVDKACRIGGRLLELGGAAAPDAGYALAKATLRDGQALRKFKEILEAQGGDPGVTAASLQPGDVTGDIGAPRAGRVMRIHNRALNALARAAGAPRQAKAGLILHVELGDAVEAGEKLLTIHTTSADRMREAVDHAQRHPPFVIE
ncbi:MAG: AMP phosphorylase [Thermoplasmatota archaeon]